VKFICTAVLLPAQQLTKVLDEGDAGAETESV
jgi:hypothetical protein